MNRLDEITRQVTELTTEVGLFIQQEAKGFDRFKIEKKSASELVSYVDKEAEHRLVAGLSAILPEAGFITEEGTIDKNHATLSWVVDPLDGTTNFIHGVPTYAISVGLKENDKIISGVVHELNLNECFYAWQGGGAYLNGKNIRISPVNKVNESLIATGFPYSMDDKALQYMEIIRTFQESCHGVRRIGSAATDMAYVACGRFDAYFEFNIKLWDIAGGIAILEEAGGIATDFSGNNNTNKVHQIEILAAGGIHGEMMNIIKKIWK